MTETEILKSVADWLHNNQDIAPERVQMDASIADDLGLDSLDQVQLVMDIEEQFDTRVDDETAGRWKTIGDIVRFLAARPVEADSFQRNGP